MGVEDTISEEEIVMTIITTPVEDGKYQQEINKGPLYSPDLEGSLKKRALDIQKQIEKTHGIDSIGTVTFGYDPTYDRKKLNVNIKKPS